MKCLLAIGYCASWDLEMVSNGNTINDFWILWWTKMGRKVVPPMQKRSKKDREVHDHTER